MKAFRISKLLLDTSVSAILWQFVLLVICCLYNSKLRQRDLNIFSSWSNLTYSSLNFHVQSLIILIWQLVLFYFSSLKILKGYLTLTDTHTLIFHASVCIRQKRFTSSIKQFLAVVTQKYLMEVSTLWILTKLISYGLKIAAFRKLRHCTICTKITSR